LKYPEAGRFYDAGTLCSPVGIDKKVAVESIDNIGWTVIAQFACERGKDSKIAIGPFTGSGIRCHSLKEEAERSLRIRTTNGLETLPAILVGQHCIVKKTVVSENARASTQLAHEGLRISKLDGTLRGMADMGNHRIALDGVILQALDPRGKSGCRRFTNEAHIPSLEKRYTPAVDMDASLAAVACQFGER